MDNLFGFIDREDPSVEQFQLLDNYDKAWCFQYDMRMRFRDEDLSNAGLTEADVEKIRVEDFVFEPVFNEEKRRECAGFIRRHEWLGTIPQYTTHWFSARWHGILAGVTLMSVPNAFSKLLGEDTDKMERLISRGACISWSPKCLASTFLMWTIKWMVANTDFRLFTAYSDPTAKELGTIYQACNFFYLGQSSGTVTRYVNPYTGKIVSDRFFRQKSAYKKYAQELGIRWQKSWDKTGRIDWTLVPDDVEVRLRDMSKKKIESARRIEYPSKHKYAYVLGRDKRETKYLRKRFLELNKVYDYPKNRGE